MNPDLNRLIKRLDYQFKDIALLETALTHRSAANKNNERMEFLGDAILGQIISIELYQRYPDSTEGELSRMRASLVKGDTLASLAKELALGDYLRLGSGELKSGGFRRNSILADAFEAVIGAVYLDSDIKRVQQYVLSFYQQKLTDSHLSQVTKDPKTQLQEYLQQSGHELPVYNVIDIRGKAHEQTFEVECHIAALKQITKGRGGSRRKAEQQAAQKALEKLGL